MTTRRLAAILAADVVGFSSMMEKDEAGTLARRCSPGFLLISRSRLVAASLLPIRVLHGDLPVSEREHVTSLHLNANAVIPSA
jgi:hypothetical protein